MGAARRRWQTGVISHICTVAVAGGLQAAGVAGTHRDCVGASIDTGPFVAGRGVGTGAAETDHRPSISHSRIGDPLPSADQSAEARFSPPLKRLIVGVAGGGCSSDRDAAHATKAMTRTIGAARAASFRGLTADFGRTAPEAPPGCRSSGNPGPPTLGAIVMSRTLRRRRGSLPQCLRINIVASRGGPLGLPSRVSLQWWISSGGHGNPRAGLPPNCCRPPSPRRSARIEATGCRRSGACLPAPAEQRPQGPSPRPPRCGA